MEAAESEREEQFASADDLLTEADQDLDGVAQELDTRLGADELRQLELRAPRSSRAARAAADRSLRPWRAPPAARPAGWARQDDGSEVLEKSRSDRLVDGKTTSSSRSAWAV